MWLFLSRLHVLPLSCIGSDRGQSHAAMLQSLRVILFRHESMLLSLARHLPTALSLLCSSLFVSFHTLYLFLNMAFSNCLSRCNSDTLRLIIDKLSEDLDEQYRDDPIEGVRQLTQCLSACRLLRKHTLPLFSASLCIDLSHSSRTRTNLHLLDDYYTDEPLPIRVMIKIRHGIENWSDVLAGTGFGYRPWLSVKSCILYGCDTSSQLESGGLAESNLELQRYLGTAMPNLRDIRSAGIQSVFPHTVLIQPHMRGTTHHIWGCRISHPIGLSRLVLCQPSGDSENVSQLIESVAASLVSLNLRNLHPTIGLTRLFTISGAGKRVVFLNLRYVKLHFRWISSHQAISCGDAFRTPLFPKLHTLILDPSEYDFTDFLLLFAPAPVARLEIEYSERSMQFNIATFTRLRHLKITLRSGYSDRYPYNPAEFLNWIMSSNPHITSMDISFAHMQVVSVPFRIGCKNLQRLKVARASFPVNQVLFLLYELPELRSLSICVHECTNVGSSDQSSEPVGAMLQHLKVSAVHMTACNGVTQIASRLPSLVRLVVDH